jgi:hypothetical protein
MGGQVTADRTSGPPWAADALTHVVDVLQRYPEARADVQERLGPELHTTVLAAQATLAAAAARLHHPAREDGRPTGASE